jgi:hemophore-related protein
VFFSYNNSASILLGLLIEEVTGTTYNTAIGNLLLDRSAVLQRPHSDGHYAGPVNGNDGVAVQAPLWLPRSVDPAGGMWCTTRDVLRYARMHLGAVNGATAEFALKLLFGTVSCSTVISSELSIAIRNIEQREQGMLRSGRTVRSAVVAVIGSGAMAGTVLFGCASVAFAEPMPAPPPTAPGAPGPGCTAADLAVASGTVGTAMGDYMFSHPDVNNFFTSLRGLPNQELRGRVQTYLDANPQVETDINAIRQPVTDLRNRCDAPPPLGE